MSTDLFQELFPWYQAAAMRMVVVSLKMSESLRELVAKTDLAQDRGEGYFIRQAISEKLERLGFVVADEDWKPASRKGVGGYPTHARKRGEQPSEEGSNLPIVADLSVRPRGLKPVEQAALAEDSATPYRSEKPRRVKLPPYNPTPVTDQVAASLLKPKGEAAVEGTPKGKAKR